MCPVVVCGEPQEVCGEFAGGLLLLHKHGADFWIYLRLRS